MSLRCCLDLGFNLGQFPKKHSLQKAIDMYISYCNEIIDTYSKTLELHASVEKMYGGNDPQLRELKTHIENAKTITKQIKKAVKFKVPSCAQLLPDKEPPLESLQGFVEKLNLPYPSICIEMDAFTLGNKQECQCVVLAEQEDDRIYVDVMVKLNNEWEMIENKETGELIGASIDRETFIPYVLGFEETEDNADYHKLMMGWFYDIPVRAVANLLCTLSCSNTHIEDSPEKPSKLKNDLRKKKKKLPLFEFKILTIDSGKNSKQTSVGGGGTHASPRIHLRRGHIRRLPTKNVWVNACVVGDKTKGVINKEYLVI